MYTSQCSQNKETCQNEAERLAVSEMVLSDACMRAKCVQKLLNALDPKLPSGKMQRLFGSQKEALYFYVHAGLWCSSYGRLKKINNWVDLSVQSVQGIKEAREVVKLMQTDPDFGFAMLNKKLKDDVWEGRAKIAFLYTVTFSGLLLAFCGIKKELKSAREVLPQTIQNEPAKKARQDHQPKSGQKINLKTRNNVIFSPVSRSERCD